MDRTDEKILELMQGNARISFQELGDAIGMSRVAAKKRVQKLESSGIIRGYNTCIYREDEYTMFIDLETAPGKLDKALDYLGLHTAYIRQIFSMSDENRVHVVAVSDAVSDLEYLAKMIRKKCGAYLTGFEYHTVKEIIKDVYGGVRYEQRSASKRSRGNERARRS